MSINRTRKNSFVIRLDDNELKQLTDAIAIAGADSRESYVRQMLLNGKIIKLDISKIKEIIALMKNATNNINQIARKTNQINSIYKDDMDGLVQEVNSLSSSIQMAYSEALKASREVRAIK